MTSPQQAQPGDSEPRVTGRPPTRRLRWWIAAFTFVCGIVVGVLGVGLFGQSVGDFGPVAAQTGEQVPTTGAQPRPDDLPMVAQAQVNAACLAVLNESQDLSAILSGLDEAVNDVDLQALDDIVRRIQPVEVRLRRDLQDCKVDAEVINNDPPSGTPVPPGTPNPSSSAAPPATSPPSNNSDPNTTAPNTTGPITPAVPQATPTQ